MIHPFPRPCQVWFDSKSYFCFQILIESSHESQDLHHRFHPLVSSRQSFCDKWQLNQAKKAGFLRSSWGWWLYNRWIDEFSSETSCAFHQKLRNQQIQRFPPSQDQLSQATMRLIRDQQNRLYTELWPQASITFHSAECQCHRKQRTRCLLGSPANDGRFQQLYGYQDLGLIGLLSWDACKWHDSWQFIT